MRYLLLAVALLASSSLQVCNEGCLRCSPDNECLLCDFTNFYRKNGQACIQEVVPYCLMADQNGGCLACEAGFMTDPLTAKCIQIPASARISRCVIQESPTTCLKCLSGFYLRTGSCVQVKRWIESCLEYASDGVCSRCLPRHLLFPDGSCREVSAVDNCRVHQLVQCRQCVSGYRLNPNLAPKYITESKKITELDAYLFPTQTSAFMLPVCEKLDIPRCESYQNAKKCLRCQQGYYPSAAGDSCQKNPEVAIAGCAVYRTVDACSVCSNGFRRTDTGQCTQVEPISFCSLYDGSSTTSVCRECASGYFLKEGNCAARSGSSVPNCRHMDPSAERCATCIDGYVISENGQMCLKEIPFCQKHTAFYGESQFACAECAANFFFEGGSCRPGLIENCHSYLSPDVCQRCLNGYYLSANTCQKHKVIANCDFYSETKNSCVLCRSNSVLFRKDNSCQLVKRIDHCERVAPDGSCQECLEGFYQSFDNQKCLPIPQELADVCQKFSATLNRCVECKFNQTIDEVGNCVPPLDLVEDGCSGDSFTTKYGAVIQANYTTCEVCRPFMVPFTTAQLTYCVDIEDMDLFDLKFLDSNCQKFSENACLECKEGFSLKEDGSCGKCPVSQSVLLYDPLTNQRMACRSLDFPGCAFHITSDDGVTPLCVHARPHYVPVVAGSTEVIPFPIGSSRLSDAVPGLRLPAWKPMPVYTPGLKLVEGCELYEEVGGVIGCIRCINGLSGPTDSSGFVAMCSKVGFCLNTQVGGLPPSITAVLSCMQCQIGSIPAIKMETSDISIWGKLQKKSEDPVITCSQISEFQDFSGENCAVAALLAPPSAVIGTFCVACKNGFYPVYAGWIVKACSPIPNCIGDSNFKSYNSCGDCVVQQNPKMAWRLNQGKTQPNYASCVATSTSNCLFADSQSVCVLCKNGYFLNLDKVCEPFSIPGCQNSRSNQPLVLRNPSMVFALASLGIIDGCAECRPGFVKLFGNETIDFCLNSTYVGSSQLIPNTLYIPNCEVYFNNASALRCSRCQSGFIPKLDKSACVPFVAQCLYADNENEFLCAVCVDNFVPNQGNCQRSSVANCLKYADQQVDSKVLICDQCRDGFVLVNNACLEGNVDFCAVYAKGNPDKCLTCQKPYVPLDAASNSTYCLNVKSSGYCLGADPDRLKERSIKCLECASTGPHHYIPSLGLLPEDTLTVCLPLNPIPNCAKYDITEEFFDSRFDCVECDTGFWLEVVQNECRTRENMDSNCEIYDTVADKCSQCFSRYVLSEDEKSCAFIPSGIHGCAVYSDARTCAECGPDFYLSGNLCYAVYNPVADCEAYDGDSSCVKCKPGFFWANKTNCTRAKATHCLVFSAADSCSQCEKGYQLVVSGGKGRCVDVGMKDCLEYDSQVSSLCVKCGKGLYLKGGKCEPVSGGIKGCVFYRDSTTCSGCEYPYVLSSNGKRCVEGAGLKGLMDPNCAEGVILDEPVCGLCASGFRLNSLGVCEPIGVSSDLIKRCLLIDPESPGECLICRQNYYMDRSGSCRLGNIRETAYTNPLWYQVSTAGALLTFLSSLLAFIWV